MLSGRSKTTHFREKKPTKSLNAKNKLKRKHAYLPSVFDELNILTLQRILGHANLTMTMRYARLAPEHLQKAKNLYPLALLALR